MLIGLHLRGPHNEASITHELGLACGGTVFLPSLFVFAFIIEGKHSAFRTRVPGALVFRKVFVFNHS